MEAILLHLFIKYVVPILVREGVMALEDATGIKTFADFVAWIKKIKTYPSGTPVKNEPFNTLT
jgi:hypothetical protein